MCSPKITVLMGEVPMVLYATTGTPALGDAMEPFLVDHEAPLLANHGGGHWGSRPGRSQDWQESLEHGARILPAARSLGRVNRLTPEQLDAPQRRRGSSRHGQHEPG